MGARAAELLLAAVNEGRHVGQRELLRGELIVRESTGTAEAGMSEVSYRGVEKRFDAESLALRSLDLDVPDGAFLVLLGPSGCGKTTALRVLAGLELPTAGTVHIGERDVTRMQPRDRDVAMVFQSYALYPHMTVAENVAYPLRIRGLSKADQRAGAAKVAEALEIPHLLDRRPRHLSGGQRQRVALARAIVREPSVFLMDEPLSNLDAKLRTSMRGEIKRLQKRLGTTTLYVTHDQAEAMTMADLVAVMRDGRAAAARAAGRDLRPPGEPLRGRVRRQPADERARGRAGRGRRSFVLGEQRLALARARRRPAARPAPRRSACGRRTSRSCLPAPTARSRARSTWSSRWATRRSSTCASASSA